jgi:Tfp pilus assembly protein PilN
MSNQINLIPHKRTSIFNRSTLLYFLQLIAGVSLCVVVVCSVVLFVLSKSGKLLILQQQDRTVTTNLTFLQEKIVKFLLIRDRLQEISPLINHKSTIDAVLGTILDGLPSTLSVNSFALTKKSISLNVSSASLSEINTFLDYMLDKVNNKQVFKKVTIVGLTDDAAGGKYLLSLDIIAL